MRGITRSINLAILLLLLSASLSAQENPNLEKGLNPYAAYSGGNLDRISVLNGNLSLQIPVLSFPQRGGVLRLNYLLGYENKGYSVSQLCDPSDPSNCSDYWTESVEGVRLVDDQTSAINEVITEEAHVPLFPYFYDWYSAVTPDGALHHLGSMNGTYEFQGQADDRAIDSSKFYRTSNGVLIDSSGTRHFPVTGVLREDANGNKIIWTETNNYSQITFTDTVGRVLPGTAYPLGTDQQVPPGIATTDFSGCSGILPIASARMVDFPSPIGTSHYKLCYANVVLSTNFQQFGPPNGNPINETGGTVSMLQSVVLPDLSTWTFEYNSKSASDPVGTNYGDLTKITLPTGGILSFTWTNLPICESGLTPTSRAVSTRTLDANDGTGPHTWQYQYGTAGPNTTTVIDPSGNETVHTFTAAPFPFGGASCSLMETQTQWFQGSHSGGTLLKTVKSDYSYGGADPFPTGDQTYETVDGVNLIRTTTIWPSGLQSKTEMDYDAGFGLGVPYGNVVTTREYDYGTGAPGSLLRRTSLSYLAFSNSNYLNQNLLDLPSQKDILDGSATLRGRTLYYYDGSTLDSSGSLPQHDLAPLNGLYRGNLTSEQHWLNTTSGYVLKSTKFFDTGMPHQVTDPNGNMTSYSYSSTYGGAYPTQTNFPDTGNPVAHHSVSGTYDLNSGLLTSYTDQNGQLSTYSYDAMFRPSAIHYPDTGSTNFSYSTAPPFTITTTKALTNATSMSSSQTLDGLGRVHQSQLVNGAYVDTNYDSIGRVSAVSNPYFNGNTKFWTSYLHDPLNRKTLITEQDGSTVQYSYNANTTTVTDESGRARKTVSDALGRLGQVIEPNPSTGSLVSASYTTAYGYDTLDNLTNVAQSSDGSQGSRNRSLSYDSLSRLITATNPESGTTCYGTWSGGNCVNGYDGNGNLLHRTDARGIVTSYTYDGLNRITMKSYSDAVPTYSNGTPTVMYGYDQSTITINSSPFSIANSIGRLSWEATLDQNGFPTTMSAFSYDRNGRIGEIWSCQNVSCSASVLWV